MSIGVKALHRCENWCFTGVRIAVKRFTGVRITVKFAVPVSHCVGIGVKAVHTSVHMCEDGV